MDIKILGLLKPSILICFLPEIASEKLTSIEGVVSKLSAKLQHAAFNNSSDDILITLEELKSDTDEDLLLYSIDTSSNSESFLRIILEKELPTSSVSF